jgi:hypothetical protein
MSVGNDLQEMENAVTRGAKSADPMQKAPNYVPDAGTIEDLGGPTPQNSKPTDDSNKIATPTKTIKKVSDVVTKGSKAADPMPKANKAAMSYEETEAKEEDLVVESETEAEEEVVAEEETISLEEKLDQIINTEVDYSDDINALSEGEQLSEEFTAKAKTIFEAVVKAKLVSAVEAMQEQYKKDLVEEVTTIREELTQRVDSYLEYVSTEWVEENALQIENGIKSELSESFMTGLKGLFEEHYVTIPEEKYDVLEGMVERLDEMESKLNEQIERNVQLNHRLSEAVSDTIFNEVTEGLALTQKEKLASLAEGVEFESESDYRGKLETLKESYFPRNSNAAQKEEMLIQENVEEFSPSMNAYLRALSKFK